MRTSTNWTSPRFSVPPSAPRVAFTRLPRWEPWNDKRVPSGRFVELFRMSLADFMWLSDEFRENLAQEPLDRGQPLTVEAQMAKRPTRHPCQLRGKNPNPKNSKTRISN
ncbi:hypothetical protein VP01_3762g3 [Puccinia sorghi]|uniref:Uncharacterized protein n=1 Tax=Puccinia sorghi TaxID=27349 RepID=A0A0L6UTW7_9BASI|nr:hypothetical protein VP01_3762g3 [Puccinia sorghi]